MPSTTISTPWSRGCLIHEAQEESFPGRQHRGRPARQPVIVEIGLQWPCQTRRLRVLRNVRYRPRAHAPGHRDLRPGQAQVVMLPKDLPDAHGVDPLHGALPPRVDRWIDEAKPGEDRRAWKHGCRWRPKGDRAGPQSRPPTVKCRWNLKDRAGSLELGQSRSNSARTSVK